MLPSYFYTKLYTPLIWCQNINIIWQVNLIIYFNDQKKHRYFIYTVLAVNWLIRPTVFKLHLGWYRYVYRTFNFQFNFVTGLPSTEGRMRGTRVRRVKWTTTPLHHHLLARELSRHREFTKSRRSQHHLIGSISGWMRCLPIAHHQGARKGHACRQNKPAVVSMRTVAMTRHKVQWFTNRWNDYSYYLETNDGLILL